MQVLWVSWTQSSASLKKYLKDRVYKRDQTSFWLCRRMHNQNIKVYLYCHGVVGSESLYVSKMHCEM